MQFMALDNLELRAKRRENLRELLILISDKEKQFEYAKTVGDRIAIDELLCMWFDDQYHEDRHEFQEMYDEDELKSLKEFNDYYNSISKQIPQDDIVKLNEFPDWEKLRKMASVTLKKLRKP
jgi:hypothetical protein